MITIADLDLSPASQPRWPADGRRLAFTMANLRLGIWDLTAGRQIVSPNLTTSHNRQLGLSSDLTTVPLGSRQNRRIRLLDAETGTD
jgi:hypothetical protein